MTDAGRGWFYAAANDRKGPVPEAEIAGLIRSGAINGETLVWAEGMAGWEPLRATPLAAHLGGASPSHDATVLAPAAPQPPPQPQAHAYSGASASTSAPNPSFPNYNPSYNPGMAYTGPTAPGEPVEGFVDAIKACFAKYVSFSGRAARPEYWWFVLFLIGLLIVAFVIDLVIAAVLGFGFVYIITALAILLPSLAAAARRLHDINRTAWWLLAPIGLNAINLVLMFLTAVSAASGSGSASIGLTAVMGIVGILALIVGITLIVFLCLAGTPGPNRFGPPPPRRPKMGM